MAAALDSITTDSSWIEFCERHAQASAQDFSKSCMRYLDIHLPENTASVTYKDFLKKYVDSFTEQFEIDFNKRRLQNTKITNGVGSKNEEDIPETEDGSPKMYHKPFFRRFVIKLGIITLKQCMKLWQNKFQFHVF